MHALLNNLSYLLVSTGLTDILFLAILYPCLKQLLDKPASCIKDLIGSPGSMLSGKGTMLVYVNDMIFRVTKGWLKFCCMINGFGLLISLITYQFIGSFCQLQKIGAVSGLT